MKNNNDVKAMLREAGILCAITLISAFVLGFVYELTKEPIRLQKEKAVQEACAAVFEEAEHFEELAYTQDTSLAAELAEQGVEIGTIYTAVGGDGSSLGYVVQSTSKEGYGGDIVIYIGIAMDGTLKDISILEISETAGLGMQAEAVLAPQFHDKKVKEFTYTKKPKSTDSEIDAISGATVTTEALVNAVNGGLKTVEKLCQGGKGNE